MPSIFRISAHPLVTAWRSGIRNALPPSIIQNGETYLEGINRDFSKPLEAYWKERTEENTQTFAGSGY